VQAYTSENYPGQSLGHELVHKLERLAHNPDRIGIAVYCSILSFCPPVLRKNLLVHGASDQGIRVCAPFWTSCEHNGTSHGSVLKHAARLLGKQRVPTTHADLDHSGLELVSRAVLNIKTELARYPCELLRLDLRLFNSGTLVDLRQQAATSRRVFRARGRRSLGQAAARTGRQGRGVNNRAARGVGSE